MRAASDRCLLRRRRKDCFSKILEICFLASLLPSFPALRNQLSPPSPTFSFLPFSRLFLPDGNFVDRNWLCLMVPVRPTFPVYFLISPTSSRTEPPKKNRRDDQTIRRGCIICLNCSVVRADRSLCSHGMPFKTEPYDAVRVGLVFLDPFRD